MLVCCGKLRYKVGMAEVLQDLIDARGISLGDLAKRSGLTPEGLRKIRRGLVGVVRVETAARLAKALKVDPARLRDAIAETRRMAK